MLYKCEYCNYTTNRLQNLERHHNRKYPCNKRHKVDTCNDEDTVENPPVATQGPPVASQEPPVASQEPPVLLVGNEKKFECSKCNKSFTRKHYLKIHESTCEGFVDPKQCKICLKVFTSVKHRWRHNKNVKCSPPTSTSPSQQTTNITNNINNTTNNNTTNNNTTNNITNNTLNNFYNITDEHIDKIVDKIGEKEYFRAAMNNVALGKYALPRTAATIYHNPNHPELQTLRKERRNDNLVDVRVGDDEWEKRVFNDVFKVIVRRVEEYYTKYFQHIDQKYKDVPVGSVRWKQLMRPIKTFGNSMLWYEGFHGDTIEGMGIELNYPDDDDPDIEREREKRNKEMENLICERIYKETKAILAL